MAIETENPKHDLGSLRISDEQRKGGRTGKIFGIFGAILGVAVLVTGGVLHLMRQKPEVEVAAAQKVGTDRPALLNASGYVTPRRRATVASKITGRVTGVFFDEGMHVPQGFVLATLDDSDVRRALESSKADRDSASAAIADFQVQLKNAELELHRAKELQAAGVQTQEALDNAGMAADSLKAKIALATQQVAAAESRVREAQQAVDNCVIRAPFDGIIVSKDAQIGRNGVAGFSGRRIHAHGHRDDRGHELERDRGGRERILHRARGTGSAGDGDFGCVSGLADSLESAHSYSNRGPAEGHGESADFVLETRSANFAGYGSESGVSG